MGVPSFLSEIFKQVLLMPSAFGWKSKTFLHARGGTIWSSPKPFINDTIAMSHPFGIGNAELV
jgi:hypothetical protein